MRIMGARSIVSKERLPILKKFAFVRIIFSTMFAAVLALPVMSSSAAIPCGELPVIEPDPNMAVPMIFIELPVTLEGALTRGGEADRSTATEADDDDAASVRMAAENQFRCLGYGMDVAFIGNSTPQQRVHMFARPSIDENEAPYIEAENLQVISLGDVLTLDDGRFLVDFAVVDGQQYLIGELIFVEVEGDLYMDGSAISESVTLNNDPVRIQLSTTFTREVKLINVSNGDLVVFDNTEEEASADIAITDPEGETIFEGNAMAELMVGGEDSNLFVIHDLEPGEYKVTVTFDEKGNGVVFGATLVVSEDASATPVASPEASPES